MPAGMQIEDHVPLCAGPAISLERQPADDPVGAIALLRPASEPVAPQPNGVQHITPRPGGKGHHAIRRAVHMAHDGGRFRAFFRLAQRASHREQGPDIVAILAYEPPRHRGAEGIAGNENPVPIDGIAGHHIIQHCPREIHILAPAPESPRLVPPVRRDEQHPAPPRMPRNSLMRDRQRTRSRPAMEMR